MRLHAALLRGIALAVFVATTLHAQALALYAPYQDPKRPEEPWQGPSFDDTLLEVDGEPVPLRAFAAWLLEVQGVELQRRFAERVVLRHAVTALGVAPTAADVDLATTAAIEDRIAKGFAGDRARYEAELRETGSSPERDRERRAVLVEDQLTRIALARATRPEPDEAALAAAHARIYGTDGRELTVRVIRARPDLAPPGAGEDDATREARVLAAKRAAEARLEALAVEVRAGADVAALAARSSDDPESRNRGGLLPAPFERATWPREVSEALAELAPGEPSRVLFAQGYYNLFVIESARAVPLGDVREALAESLRATVPDIAQQRVAVARALNDAAPSLTWHDAGPRPIGVDAALPLDTPLFQLGDERYTRGDFALWIARDRGSDLVRPFVRDLRLARRAAAEGVVATSEVIDAQAEATFQATLRQVYGGDRARMARDHERRGITEEHLRAQFAREAWRELTADALLRRSRVVADEDVHRAWEERHGPLGKSYDVRVIARSLAGRDRDEEFARLRGLADEVRRGADFGALAARWSDDERTRSRGGRPAGRFRHEEAPEDFRRALEQLEPGAPSEPLEADGHLVLILLEEVVRVPLADVAAELRAELVARPTTQAERLGLLMSFDLDDACTYHAERLFRPAPR